MTDNNALAQELGETREFSRGTVHISEGLFYRILAALRTPAPVAGEVGEPVAWLYTHGSTNHAVPYLTVERDAPFAKLRDTIETPLYTADMLERLAGPVHQAGDHVNMSASEMKALWKAHGGDQHGPRVEQYYIKEADWYKFAKALYTKGQQSRAALAAMQPKGE